MGHENLFSGIDLEYMIGIRRRLHMFPETGFDLPLTLELVKRELDGIGVPYTEKYGKSSLVAVMNEEKSSYTIGIRADMDALLIRETNEIPYRSQYEGKMHACGHDAHTAMLLGTIKALYPVREKINCRVMFLFQASEEGPSGARLMVQDGVMDEIDCIVACHMENAYETGTVATMPGAVMSSCNSFTIELFGRSSHSAYPHTAIDAISMGVKVYSGLQFLVAREINPFDTCVLSIGVFQAGRSNNVIADYCKLAGTLRTHSGQVTDFIMKRMENIVKNISIEVGGKFKITKSPGLPVVYNDELLTEKFFKSAAKVLGSENVIKKDKPLLVAEDFALYQEKKPGVYFFLGSGNKEKGIVNKTHMSNWDIDEAAMENGVKVFIQFVLDNMDNT